MSQKSGITYGNFFVVVILFASIFLLLVCTGVIYAKKKKKKQKQKQKNRTIISQKVI